MADPAPTPARELGTAGEALEYGDVLIGDGLIGAGAGIGPPGQDLGVAGIGEPEGVGDARARAVVAVADQRAVLGEGEQERGERLRAIRDVDIAGAIGGVGDERRIGAAEEILPAQAVNGDQHDVRGRLLCGRGPGKSEHHQRRSRKTSPHG